MKTNLSTRRAGLIAATLAVAAVGFAGSAQARDNVSFSVGIGVPGVQVGVTNAYPVYPQPVYQQPIYQQPVYQQPVYVQPAPVYVQPRPVYYAPQPVYIAPQQVYYTRPGHRHGHRGGYYAPAYAPVYYRR